MAMFFPIYNRSSDSLNQARLTNSLQANQMRLQQLQQQIATGNRIDRMGQDPGSGIRAMGYQAAIEQNVQFERNLKSNQGYLAATDTSLRSVNDLLSQIRGESVGWASTTLTEADRKTAVQQLSTYRDQLLTLANTQYQGRYLFAGADTRQQPYVLENNQVVFRGNEAALRVPSTADVMVQSNVSGQFAFGGRSTVLQGTPDLQAQLGPDTRLSDLRGGRGVQLGTIQVGDGYGTANIDLTSAETVGDVIRLIETNAPSGRHLKVDIVSDRLDIRFADDGGEDLWVNDANGGRAAADLGIRTGVGTTLPGRIQGDPLRPQINLTTPLDSLTGTRATAYLSSPGLNNDIRFLARENGNQENGLTIQYVDSEQLQAGAGLRQGSEEVYFETTARNARVGLSFSGVGNDLLLTASQPGTVGNGIEIRIANAGSIGDAATVSFDSTNRILTIGVDDANATTTQSVMDAINAEGTFAASADLSDPVNGPFDPAAVISAADAGVVRGNTGNSGGEANTVYIHVNPTATNGYHVMAALQKNTELNERFDISLSPTDGPVNGFPGKAIIDASATARTDGGGGEIFDRDSGLQVTVDGITQQISLANAETVEDLINAVNASGNGVYAQINAQRNGLVLGIEQAGATFTIGENGGQTATQLGLRSMRAETPLASLNQGRGVATRPGTDFTIIRSDGTEIEVDLSQAKTLQDVLDRINQHPDNQTPLPPIVARLASSGNGIELLEDNPSGSSPLTVRREFGSNAAIDLGLVPPGEEFGYPAAANVTHAGLEVRYADQVGLHRSFSIKANLPGDQYNHIEVVTVAGATGDNASATFDAVAGTLTIQVDPTSTRTSTIVSAIRDTGLFQAELIANPDGSFNNGSGIVSTLGAVGTLSGGSALPAATPASVLVRPEVPNQFNTALTIEAQQPGTRYNGYSIRFQSGAIGDSATATVDDVTRELIITIDPAATTANTILAAIDAEGTFSATLNTEVDPSNDGTGIFAEVGVLGTTTGGAPAALKARDVNPLENQNIFNTIERFIAALSQPDPAATPELQHAARLLELDIDRLSRAMAEVGARHQYNEFLLEQNGDLLIDLKANLSEEMEVDMVEAISSLTAQQATVEASLRMMAQTFQTSLLDYI